MDLYTDWPANTLVRCVTSNAIIPTKKARHQLELPKEMKVEGNITSAPAYIFVRADGEYLYFIEGKTRMEFKVPSSNSGCYWPQKVHINGGKYGFAVVMDTNSDRSTVSVTNSEKLYLYDWKEGRLARKKD
jgi:hypothetical protein